MTPPLGRIPETADQPPRNLNEPVCCRHSALTKTRRPAISSRNGDDNIGVRCTLAALVAWLGFGVEWVFGVLIADYIVKASLLALRFRSDRWQSIQLSPSG